MDNLTLVWWVSILIPLCLWWAIASVKGPRIAIGIVGILIVCCASWSQRSFQGLPLYARDVAYYVCLISYCFHPKSTYPWRLNFLDATLLTLLFVHVLSDGLHDGWNWRHAVRAYGEWCAPYLAARLAFQRWDEIEKLIPVGAAVAALLGLDAILESWFAFHPWEWIYGLRPDENFGRLTMRWGLYRPWGPTAHAIYFGAVQLAVLPWAALAAWQAWHRKRPSIWLFPVVLSGAGIFCTVSRGPLLAAAMMGMIVLFILKSRLRIPIGLAVIGLLLLVLWKWDAVSEIADTTGTVSNGRPRGQMIEVDGKRIEYSGSKTRWVIFSLYRRAMWVAGWTGYGTEATEVFPPRVPMGTSDRDTWSRVRFVDNSFVLMTLRFGWLGVTAMGLLFVLAATRWWVRGIHGDFGSVPAAWFAAVILCNAFLLMTVWLAPDFKYFIFWWIGTASTQPSTSWNVALANRAPSWEDANAYRSDH